MSASEKRSSASGDSGGSRYLSLGNDPPDEEEYGMLLVECMWNPKCVVCRVTLGPCWMCS